MKQKTLSLLFIVTVLLGNASCGLATDSVHQDYQPQHGDVIFQSLGGSPLTNMIEGTTRSNYSHCGIVELRDDTWWVIEAIGPVTRVPLDSWIKRGRNDAFAVYRLKDTYQDSVQGFVAAAHEYLGKPYDIRYRFDDRNIYCSELVFKSFRDATGEELGNVVRLKDLNWQPYVSLIKKIERGGPVPLEREIITPSNLAMANQLELIIAHGIKPS